MMIDSYVSISLLYYTKYYNCYTASAQGSLVSTDPMIPLAYSLRTGTHGGSRVGVGGLGSHSAPSEHSRFLLARGSGRGPGGAADTPTTWGRRRGRTGGGSNRGKKSARAAPPPSVATSLRPEAPRMAKEASSGNNTSNRLLHHTRPRTPQQGKAKAKWRQWGSLLCSPLLFTSLLQLN